MKLLDVAREVRRHLEENGRVSLRLLRRDYALDDDALDELIEELVDVQQIARREGNVLVWAATTAPRETRKVISVIFADLMGSTSLQERLDPESVNRVMDAYYQAVRGPVEAGGGTVVQLMGDGVLCAFGVPTIAEDDALRAVRAAMGIQEAFRRFLATQPWPIGLRVAVNTGEVVVSDEHPAGLGDPLNVAARLQQEARDGEVLIGPATRRLVADAVTLEPAGVFTLRGRAEPVTAHRVVSLEPPAGAGAAAFVGRDDELARLTAVYETACSTPAARLAVLVGAPGLGKSRLIDELVRRLGDGATVIAAHCDAVGGPTFAPLADALREWDPIPAALLANIADRDRIVAGITALLAGSPAAPEETFFVVRRLLTVRAAERPVVLVIDDLHWAEPLLLDLIEHLIQWGSGVPLFVLVGGRPELRALRSSLVTPGGLVSDVVTLAGLDAGAAMRLAANVIGAGDLPAAVAAKVLATSEGNPLFVRELMRMLIDEGAIERHGDRFVVGANLAALEMPPTIHALLAARIDRLRAEERGVLERAAVVGRHFSRGAVSALLGRDADAYLQALRSAELIETDAGWFLGEPLLRFRHVLIRDAAYRRLLKGTRAQLHERVAEWIEAKAGAAVEHDETVGWHLEQAHRNLRELGPLDDRARVLGERAAGRLAAAGRRALARDDVSLAAALLGRAIDLLDEPHPDRADLALDWCEALLSAGDVAHGTAAIAELARLAVDSERIRAWHTCFASQLTVLTAPQDLQAVADVVAHAAEILTRLGDAGGEAKAHSVHAQALARVGRMGESEAALDQALAAARRAGDRRRANAVLAGAPLAALWGPSPVTRASGRCLDVVRVLRITQGAPAVEAVALSCQGMLEALRGRTDAARRMIAASRRMVQDLGIAHRLFEADVFGGRIDLLEGDAPAAERRLRDAFDGLRGLGLGIDAARAGALLARAQLAQGKVEDAERSSRESEALAGDDLQAAIAWRGVRAEALARQGETQAAVALAQAAVALAATTDAFLDHADARLALAAALRADGHDDEADREELRAVELWESKGATLLAERAGRRSPPPSRLPEASPARVRPNAATRNAERLLAATQAHDAGGVMATCSPGLEVIHHPTGLLLGASELIAGLRPLFAAGNVVFGQETLASLGESLALVRRTISQEDVQSGVLVSFEVDAEGRQSRSEVFDGARLDDAIARLYQRHAELLPEGAERRRAAATAQTMAVFMQGAGAGEAVMAPVVAPDVEGIDHRRIGTWSGRGAPAYFAHLRALTDSVVFDHRDVLALRPNALLVRVAHSGIDRASGGRYERLFLSFLVLGDDGRLTHVEWFDADRDAEALARLDELVEPMSLRLRPRPNRALEKLERFGAALAARDVETLAHEVGETVEVIHHPTGATYGREAMLTTWRVMFRADHMVYRQEPLATLGDTLALGRSRISLAGIAEQDLVSAGSAEIDTLVLFEVDAVGRVRRVEIFATERLGNAVVRLYDRHAELLPTARARATARAITAMVAPPDLDRYASALSPDVEFADHRTVGFTSGRGAGELLRGFGSLLELAADVATRVDEILALEPDALLLRWTTSGTDRTSGGAFESSFLLLWQFGADGLIARDETFDVDRVVEARARFDELRARH